MSEIIIPHADWCAYEAHRECCNRDDPAWHCDCGAHQLQVDVNRVVAERNALRGEVTRQRRLETAAEAAFLAGFEASGEGFNGEHPFSATSPDATWGAIEDEYRDWAWDREAPDARTSNRG